MFQIDILLLAYNRLNYLNKTIDSFRANTDCPFRLIVVDNASTDPAVRMYLDNMYKSGKLENILYNNSNMIMKGWDSGIKELKSRYFVLSDPDILVPGLKPCWLTQLVELLDRFPRIARIGLSLDQKNVPPCWNKKQAKKLCFKTGPFFDKNNGLRITDVDTTTQLIRTEYFKHAYGNNVAEINMDFWKKYHKYGLSVSAQNVTAVHLGWNEYMEETEYLLEKVKNIRDYPEKKLIKKTK